MSRNNHSPRVSTGLRTGRGALLRTRQSRLRVASDQQQQTGANLIKFFLNSKLLLLPPLAPCIIMSSFTHPSQLLVLLVEGRTTGIKLRPTPKRESCRRPGTSYPRLGTQPFIPLRPLLLVNSHHERYWDRTPRNTFWSEQTNSSRHHPS